MLKFVEIVKESSNTYLVSSKCPVCGKVSYIPFDAAINKSMIDDILYCFPCEHESEHIIDEYLEKIDSGVLMSEDELEIFENSFSIHTKKINSENSDVNTESICKLNNRYFSLKWFCDDNDWYLHSYKNQPKEIYMSDIDLINLYLE